MPLNLPDKLPAIELLKEENIFVIVLRVLRNRIFVRCGL